ncbi:hypothetical protein VMCG_01452 [Cytospora schulzeri]|uniref:Uncharacterized protein n=1 Tax=Cytospora schulzeri TaxID=448051 RepID=A0A423X5N4_9PEZI|nr:hypothetical protein VMCG_01452 [Valsa malicola]
MLGGAREARTRKLGAEAQSWRSWSSGSGYSVQAQWRAEKGWDGHGDWETGLDKGEGSKGGSSLGWDGSGYAAASTRKALQALIGPGRCQIDEEPDQDQANLGRPRPDR